MGLLFELVGKEDGEVTIKVERKLIVAIQSNDVRSIGSPRDYSLSLKGGTIREVLRKLLLLLLLAGDDRQRAHVFPADVRPVSWRENVNAENRYSWCAWSTHKFLRRHVLLRRPAKLSRIGEFSRGVTSAEGSRYYIARSRNQISVSEKQVDLPSRTS